LEHKKDGREMKKRRSSAPNEREVHKGYPIIYRVREREERVLD